MSEPTNDDRAEWAEAALMTFKGVTGSDREDLLADLLCDLMHWADREYFVPTDPTGFDAELARARMHYEAEVQEELEEGLPMRGDKLHVFQFQVVGRGTFPMDMLRHDQCFPATENDSTTTEDFSGVRTITLQAHTYNSYWRPTARRWASFGWEVLEETVRALQ